MRTEGWGVKEGKEERRVCVGSKGESKEDHGV